MSSMGSWGKRDGSPLFKAELEPGMGAVVLGPHSALDTTRNPNHFTLGISRKFRGEYSHLCTEAVPDKQVLTRSSEQAEERETPPAFIFVPSCSFYV